MQAEQWQAIVDCDASYDGTFFYAVLTTGIFCRPSCKSRTPKPGNVKVFDRAADAMAANFRACKRCRPDQLQLPLEELAQRVLQLVESRYAEPLSLPVMASELHVSPYHLHRVFKRVTGKTPAEQLLATRLERAKQLLAETDKSVTEISAAVGFANMGHFSTVFQKHVGMSPSVYRAQVEE